MADNEEDDRHIDAHQAQSSISSDISFNDSYSSGFDIDDDRDGAGLDEAAAERRPSISSIEHLNRKTRVSRRSSGTKGVSKPNPVSLLGFEVIRTALRIQAETFDVNEKDTVLKTYRILLRFIDIEREFEKGFCKVIDEKYYADRRTAKFQDRHLMLQEYEDDFFEAIDDGNIEAAKTHSFPVLQEETLRYLKELEAEFKDPLRRMKSRGEPVEKYLQGIFVDPTDGDSTKKENLKFYIKYANETLKDEPARLEFNQTLWWASDRDEKWNEILGWIGESEANAAQVTLLVDAIELYEQHETEMQEIQNSSDPEMMVEKLKAGLEDKPPVAVVEIRTGLAKILPRRRSSQG